MVANVHYLSASETSLAQWGLGTSCLGCTEEPNVSPSQTAWSDWREHSCGLGVCKTKRFLLKVLFFLAVLYTWLFVGSNCITAQLFSIANSTTSASGTRSGYLVEATTSLPESRQKGEKDASVENSVYAKFINEDDAQKYLEESGRKVEEIDLQLAIGRSWWNLSKAFILKSHDEDLDFSSVVRSAVAEIRLNADELIRLLNKRHGDIALMSPAFQWAESPEHVFLNIKFAYRWSSPGALSVENEVFETTPCCFFFSGLGAHSHVRKKYVLELELFDELDPNETEWSFASVGKVFVTLRKKTPGMWNQLTRSSKKLTNMAVWWDMEEKFQEEVNDFIKAESKSKTGDTASDRTNATEASAPAFVPKIQGESLAENENDRPEGIADESVGSNAQAPNKGTEEL